VSDINVRPLDVHDDAEYAAAYDVFERAEKHGRGDYGSIMGPDSLRSGFTQPTSMRLRWAWTARRGGSIAGLGALTLPLTDNQHLCYVDVSVAPEHRRGGVGSALLDRLEQAVRAAGRRVLIGEVTAPIAAESWPGAEFAKARGYALALHEAHEVLELPVPDDRLRSEPRDGYRILSWQDRCPDEWAAAYCDLLRSFTEEAPTGDLDMEPTEWTVERLQAEEQRRIDRGRRAYASVAVSPDGRLVGYTEIVLLPDNPDAHQEETLVQPEHRGHRLGVAIKAANLRQLQADAPDRPRIHTYVSPGNDAMNAVNRALGFTPVEYCDEWQRDLSIT
jgi:GNAT superfamily N-acetyltransferase